MDVETEARGARHVGPPRTLDVLQFAAARARELQALYSALKAQRKDCLAEQPLLTTRRHLRRRTASHNRRPPFRWTRKATSSKMARVKPLKLAVSLEERTAAPEAGNESSLKRKKPEKHTPSRRVRRRIELQGIRNGTGSSMRDGTNRLATHVWHAKRFRMARLWGYCLPIGLPGRGKGSKALFKWVKDSAVLHDASYIGVIELQGSTNAILGTLDKVLEPGYGPLISGSAVKEEIDGLCYGNAVLHSVGNAPREAIAPVTTLWCPSNGGTKSDRTAPQLHIAGNVAVEERQVWIWVHPSAFDKALEALSTACTQGTDQATVNCRSRRGELARLDILGTKALDVLQKVLCPVPRGFSCLSSKEVAGHSHHEDVGTSAIPYISSEIKHTLSARIFADADCLPATAMLPLEVYDPRNSPLLSDSVEGDVFVDKKEESEVFCSQNLMKEVLPDLASLGSLFTAFVDQKLVPLSQKAFSDKRQKRRQAFYRGMDADEHENSFEDVSLDTKMKEVGTCPILLLKRIHARASACGWSIIMPITWVHAFWVPIVFAGGHVIGLRERHWLATDAGMPYFPHDFPDCPAYSQHLAAESAAYDCENKRRPPSKRARQLTYCPLQMSILDVHRTCLADGIKSDSAVARQPVFDNDILDRCTVPVTTNIVDDAHFPALTNLNVDIRAPQSGPLTEMRPSSPVMFHSTGEAGPTKPIKLIGDSASNEDGKLVVGPSSPVTVGTSSGAGIPELDEDTSITEAIIVAEVTVGPVDCCNADVSSVCKLTNLVDHTSANEGVIQVFSPTSLSNSSQLQHVMSDACGAQLYNSASEPKVSSEEETGTSKPTSFCHSEALEMSSLTKSLDDGQSCKPPPSSPEQGPCLAITDDRLAIPSFFVSRTIKALMDVLKESDSKHALILHPGLMSKRVVQDGLKEGRLEWQVSNGRVGPVASPETSNVSALVRGRMKACYIRVLVEIPRKGVMAENDLLCSPTKEDFNNFLSRQHWQGVETSSVNKQVKQTRKRKGKRKRRGKPAEPLPAEVYRGTEDYAKSMLNYPDEGFHKCGNRETIGFIMSTGPQGSFWSATGVCEVGSLMKLRALQWADQRWWESRKILLLAGNKSSPRLRPVLVSIAMELGSVEDILW